MTRSKKADIALLANSVSHLKKVRGKSGGKFEDILDLIVHRYRLSRKHGSIGKVGMVMLRGFFGLLRISAIYLALINVVSSS